MRFEVGDHVTILRSQYWTVNRGDEGVVVRVHSLGPLYEVQVGSYNWVFYNHELKITD